MARHVAEINDSGKLFCNSCDRSANTIIISSGVEVCISCTLVIRVAIVSNFNGGRRKCRSL